MQVLCCILDLLVIGYNFWVSWYCIYSTLYWNVNSWEGLTYTILMTTTLRNTCKVCVWEITSETQKVVYEQLCLNRVQQKHIILLFKCCCILGYYSREHGVHLSILVWTKNEFEMRGWSSCNRTRRITSSECQETVYVYVFTAMN